MVSPVFGFLSLVFHFSREGDQKEGGRRCMG